MAVPPFGVDVVSPGAGGQRKLANGAGASTECWTGASAHVLLVLGRPSARSVRGLTDLLRSCTAAGLSDKFDKAYEGKNIEELATAPVRALQSLSEAEDESGPFRGFEEIRLSGLPMTSPRPAVIRVVQPTGSKLDAGSSHLMKLPLERRYWTFRQSGSADRARSIAGCGRNCQAASDNEAGAARAFEDFVNLGLVFLSVSPRPGHPLPWTNLVSAWASFSSYHLGLALGAQ
jgi:hypothetical protein